MFYPEEIERQILHNSTSKVPFDNKPLKKPLIHTPDQFIIDKAKRTVGGGSQSGVSTMKPPKLLHSSSMSGGSKKLTVWQALIKNTMKDKGLSMKDAIKYIKSNNLY
jgi:hypothetical protein